MENLALRIHSRFGSQYWQYRVKLRDGTIIRRSTGIKKSDDPNKFQAKSWVKHLYKDKIFDRIMFAELKMMYEIVKRDVKGDASLLKKDIKKQFGYII